MSDEKQMVDSASDERTVNNVMRHNYRVLTDEEKSQMRHLKDLGAHFVDVLHEVGGTAGIPHARMKSRELSIAQTKIEEAVMWAVKHITR